MLTVADRREVLWKDEKAVAQYDFAPVVTWELVISIDHAHVTTFFYFYYSILAM